jgi:general secretion pathway protein K
MTRRAGAESGSVAILVLWGVALIFILLAPVAFSTASELRMTENALAAARARHAAEAGTQLGLARLLRRHQEGGALFDGSPEAWRQGPTAVAIAVADEAGKIDVNVAPLELVAGLFAAAGRSQAEALLLACNVLDHRGDTASGCPEPEEDSSARPHPHRFLVPEEVAQLPGVDDALYDRIADDITVASGASAIDPAVAPRTVLLAIPGATESLVDSYLDSRGSWHGVMPAGNILALLPATPYLMTSPGRDFTIVATATTPDRASYRAELQVRLTDRPTHPYEIIAWRAPPVDRGK